MCNACSRSSLERTRKRVELFCGDRGRCTLWESNRKYEGVCVCVCVYERERKKERVRERDEWRIGRNLRARKEGIKTSLGRFNAQRIMCTYTSGPEVSHNIINPLTSDEATVRRMIVEYTGRSGKSSGTGFVYTLFLVAFYCIIILLCSALRDSSDFVLRTVTHLRVWF
jgi:hypothetical protein